MCHVLGACFSYATRTQSKRSGETVTGHEVRGRCFDEPDAMMKIVDSCKVREDM